MTPTQVGELLKSAAHPTGTYVTLVTFVVGVFRPDVTAEKLFIVATVLGAFVGFRVLGKQIEATTERVVATATAGTATP